MVLLRENSRSRRFLYSLSSASEDVYSCEGQFTAQTIFYIVLSRSQTTESELVQRCASDEGWIRNSAEFQAFVFENFYLHTPSMKSRAESTSLKQSPPCLGSILSAWACISSMIS